MSEKEDRIIEEAFRVVDEMVKICAQGLADLATTSADANGEPLAPVGAAIIDRFLLGVAQRTYGSCPACVLRNVVARYASYNKRPCPVCASRTSAEHPLGLDWQ